MEEAIALIDKIIEEHKTIFQGLQNLEQIANDAEAIKGFDKTKELFMPGKLDEKQGLEAFQKLLDTIIQGIQDHFSREEGALVTAFEKHADRKLASALHSLLLEHEDLKSHLERSKQDVAKLTDGGLSRQIWEASAYDIRTYITNTRKLFEEHAVMEQDLLHTLRNELTKDNN